MKFEKKILKDHQAQLDVKFDQKTFDQYKVRAAKKISSRSKVPGFRPGKAPLDVVARMHGEDFVNEEALEILVQDKYPVLLEEAEIKPASAGKLEKVEKLDPPHLIFVVPLEPEVELGKYKDIRKSFELPDITDKEIKEVIHNLQLNYATAQNVEREAKKGDLVNFKLTATITNPDEGQDAELLKDSPYQMIIGEKQREEFPFDGFDKELIGLKEQDKKDLSHKYTKKSNLEKLQGKEVKFDIEILNVKELQLPEVDDEFAKNVSGLDSVDTLKESIKNQLAYTKNADYEEKYYNDLIDEIISISKIAYPPVLLEEEIDRVLHDFEHKLSHQNMDLDLFLKLNKMEMDEFKEKELAPVAKKQLEHSLVLDEISKVEDIELKQDDLEMVYRQTMYEYQSRDDFKKVKRDLSPKKLANSILMQAASRLMNRQVLDLIKKIANEETEEEEAKKEESSDSKESKAAPENVESEEKSSEKAQVKKEEPKVKEGKNDE